MRLLARSTIRSWLVCLAFLLAIAVPAVAMAGTVSGVVTDADTGTPIADAWVDAYLLPDYWETIGTMTDVDGSYMLGLPDGMWDVWITAPGYEQAWVTVDGSAATVQDFSLTPAVAGVQGTITDADSGEPLWGGAYLYYYDEMDSAWYQIDWTGCEGDYTFFGLEEGTQYLVETDMLGYENQQSSSFVYAGSVVTKDFSLNALPPAGIGGYVTDAQSGDPLWGEVYLEWYDADWDDWVPVDMAYAEPGSYLFPFPEIGQTYRLSTSFGGYINETTGSFVYEGAPLTYDFALEHAAVAVSGNITDAESGAPLSGDVYLYQYDFDMENWFEVDWTWAEDGYYEFYGLVDGQYYSVGTSVYTYENQTSDSFLFEGGSVVQDFQLTPLPVAVYGSVTDAESGDLLWGELIIEQLNADTGEWDFYDWAWCDEAGYFVYGLVPSDQPYRLTTAINGWVDQSSDSFYYGGTTVGPIDFALDRAPVEVSGVVTDADTGLEIEGDVVLFVWDEMDETWYDADWAWSYGGYEFRDLTPGRLYLVETAVEDYNNEMSESFIADGSLHVFDFALTMKAIGVTGTVTDAESGEPLWGDIYLETLDAESGDWYVVDNDWSDEGSYELRGLTEGETYHVVTDVAGYIDAISDSFVYAGEPLVMDFQLDIAPVGVFGTVTDSVTGDPLDAELALQVHDTEWDEWWEVDYAWTDGGAYEFRDMVEGWEYRVSAQVENYFGQVSDSFIYEGDPTEYNFALVEAPVGVTGSVTDIDTGAPLEGDMILEEWNADWSEWMEVTYNYASNGSYELRGLSEGVTYRVRAAIHGYETAYSDEFTYDGTLQVFDFALTALPTQISGMVTDAVTGDPLDAWVYVEIWDALDQEWYYFEWAETVDGAYSVTGLEPGERYRMVVYADGYHEATGESFTYDGTQLEFDFALDAMPVSITGAITDASTGEPMEAGVSYYYYDPELDEWVGDGGWYEGEYAFYELIPGQYYITVEAEGYETFESEPFEYDGETTVVIDAALAPEGWSPELDVEPIAGTSRYGTAIAASQQAFPDGANCVVIATGSNWPDALGGASLAAAKGGPILLTQQGALPAEVLAEIRRLDASEAVVLGGTAAVGAPVFNALKAELGAENVTRIGGAGRYETAELVAKATVAELGEGYDGTCFIATGGNFPDALGASPLAAAQGWPLLLAGPSGLSASTLATINEIGVDKALILGGKAVVADSVMTQLAGRSPQRLAGTSRYETAKIVAQYGVDNAGLSWDKVAIATGQNFPDALAGGVLQGIDGSVMLLTPSNTLDAAPRAALTDNKADIHTVRFLGGTAAVSTSVRNAVAAILEP